MADHCPLPGTAAVEWTQVGPCQVWATWTADSTSVYPGCDGAIEQVRVANTSDTAWTVRVPRAGNQNGRLVTVDPRSDITLTKQQCNARGYDLISDMRDLLLSLT